MQPKWLDLSARGWGRVVLLTVLGTACCIALALVLDNFSFTAGVWQWQPFWTNDVYIPLVIAPPFFFFLLFKLRQLAIAHQDLMTLASVDSLTSCLTRRAFTALVDGYMERLSREAPQNGALLVIDVDHFKVVNDRFGHEQGDEALKSVAEAIRASVRSIDLVGRLGGEEFGVFLPGLGPGMTLALAERIRAAVRKVDFRPKGVACDLSISVGGATFEERASFTELFREADERLYTAKRNGRNRVEMTRHHRVAAATALH